MSIANYKDEFDRLLGRENFSSAMHSIRKDAFEKLKVTGLPTKKWENWRFTDLSDITDNNFSISQDSDAPNKTPDISKYNIDGIETIVIYNGHLQNEISSVPKGIQLLNHLEYYEFKNSKEPNPDNSPFDLLNTAFMNSGVCMVIPEGIIVEKPVRILFISDGENSIMVNPRVHISLESGSSVTFIEEHVGDAVCLFHNETIFFEIDKNANCEHINIQSNSINTYNMVNIHSKQSPDSVYNYYQYQDGGKFSRCNIYIDLNGINSECNINSLSLSRFQQHFDNNIVINHNVSNTLSSQIFKSALLDKSSGVFNGKSIVKKNAQKIEAHQSNNNLLLSKSATMNSIPQLEIYADDVKCTHGSTSGQLDEDALFYLRSRGISKEEAFVLLFSGFVGDVTNKIKFMPLKNYINKKVDAWIKN